MEITEIGLLAVKKETTYGTDPAPTLSANIIPTVRDQVTWSVQSTEITRKLLDGSLDYVPGFNAKPNVTLKFRYEARGNYVNGGTTLDITNGTSAQAIEIDCLLQAANLIPAYTAAGTPGVGGSSAGSRDGYVIYSPAIQTTQGPSVTCYFYTALKLHKLIGGKVDVDITFQAGNMVFLEFTVTGKYVAVADNTFSTANAAYLAVKPPLFDAGTLTLDSYTPVVDTLKIMLGNKIDLRTDATAVDSIAGFVIGNTQPKGTIDPESVTEAANPFWADWKSNTVRTLTATVGNTGGNKLSGIFKVEYKNPNYGTRNSVRTHQLAFNIVKADLTQAAGSQFQLKFF